MKVENLLFFLFFLQFLEIAYIFFSIENGDAPAWTPRLASVLSPSKFSPVYLRSNRWPGATVISYNDKFTNIYVGDGLKDLGSPTPKFAPPLLPAVQSEFGGETLKENPELLNEQLDPTIEQEAALEAERKAKEETEQKEEEEAEAEE